MQDEYKAGGGAAGDADSGVAGLDEVLGGGLARPHVYVLEGAPGTGKTTMALQFLLAGARRGETGLYVTLSETAGELRAGAASHGWSLDALRIFELLPAEAMLTGTQLQSLVPPADLELGETIALLLGEIARVRPARIVLDSLSEIRLLAQSSWHYRRQVLALKHHFGRASATVLMLDDLAAGTPDRAVHSVAHGVLRLEELAPEYGAERRRLRVLKYRGRPTSGGFHDFIIGTGGVRVFPRLVAAAEKGSFDGRLLTSGIAEMDALLGGGLEQGTSALLVGPSGTGKSLLAHHFAVTAIRRGERAASFLFDEDPGLLIARTRAMGLDIGALAEAGRLHLEAVDPAELPPGQFAQRIRDLVAGGVRTIVIDSLNGYQAAMPEESFLILHLHELLQFLSRHGVTTIATIAMHGVVGQMTAPLEMTYLADTVVMLRYFELGGRVRRAISVLKKRAGGHENAIRELDISQAGLRIGAVLAGFRGVLAGTPTLAAQERLAEALPGGGGDGAPGNRAPGNVAPGNVAS
jgi:circadian clock protein KaiC